MSLCVHLLCVWVWVLFMVWWLCVCGLFTRLIHDMLYICMHVHFFTVTFFWTLELNNAMDTKVCSPHISLLRSFSKTARAMQIPGWCCDPFLDWFLWSLWLAMTEATWNRVGACVFNSCMNVSSENSPRWSILIRLNGERSAGFFRQTVLHSGVITSKSFVTMHFCSSWCATTALAIEGIFPPFKTRPIFCRSGLKVDVRGLVWEGLCTTTCGMLTQTYAYIMQIPDTYLNTYLPGWMLYCGVLIMWFTCNNFILLFTVQSNESDDRWSNLIESECYWWYLRDSPPQ